MDADTRRIAASVRSLSLALPQGGDRANAVDGVSFDLVAGEILCLVGESGSGKSMCAHALMGLLPKAVRPVGGTIRLGDTDLLAQDEAGWRDTRGRRIAMIFQEPMTALNPLMRIGDQMAEMFEAHGMLAPKERRARAVALAGEVGLPNPEQIVRSYPHQLSGGQRQRAMIAMALALEPAVLVADEPTTALDVTTQAQILKLIRDLQTRRDMAVLFITHDFGVVAEIADRVLVLRHGRVVEEGPASAVLGRPQAAYTRALLAAVPTMDPPARPPLSGPKAVEVTGLQKTYVTGGGLWRAKRRTAAARDVAFALHRGETLGLVGESGSGKSSVARLVMRLIEPDSGRIRLGDTDLTGLRGEPLRQARSRIQMIFQDPFASLNPRRSVGKIIADGPVAHGVPPGEAMERARRLLGLVGLDEKALERFPHEFSGGQRQRIGIARALALEPEVLVADEAVSALDVSVQAQVLALLEDLKTRLGLSMLFITHDLRVAAQICDRIAVMRQGEIVELKTAGALFANPEHPYTRALLDAVPGRVRQAA
ncbi:ABC transporter ATP-binding protein [Methylobacterium platani]|uniref:Microcin ABC transporter ATP-binding protein n=2 Tax=Methylobacterium platani TaxID=427683 RepID=A0A179RYP2_9HYPH|nr:ABC transporter ATP-binding protein [Methylobacterium platani]KMO15907.1 microcin ABC transporter ATP-binding protein [Methylobacterium platani JCM 14648]OAS15460.1 microcin ABC transporter ATP-binding protein [Methylobacterium platani]